MFIFVAIEHHKKTQTLGNDRSLPTESIKLSDNLTSRSRINVKWETKLDFFTHSSVIDESHPKVSNHHLILLRFVSNIRLK